MWWFAHACMHKINYHIKASKRYLHQGGVLNDAEQSIELRKHGCQQQNHAAANKPRAQAALSGIELAGIGEHTRVQSKKTRKHHECLRKYNASVNVLVFECACMCA